MMRTSFRSMIQSSPAAPVAKGDGRHRGFTLAELLVVIGIIAVVTGITAVSFSVVARDARQSSAVNTIKASLDNARALAMKNNQIVMVVFRPRLDGAEQYVEAIFTEYKKSFYITSSSQLVDIFHPVEDIPVRRLPKGVSVAAPSYGDISTVDSLWETLAYLPAIDQSNPTAGGNEAPGILIAVMFDGDGTSITRNSNTDSNATMVDFDLDDQQSLVNVTSDPVTVGSGPPFEHRVESDECYVSLAPFIAVFDVAEARENYDTTAWDDAVTRLDDLNDYIFNNADRLNFNRYTGVVMK